MSLSLTVLALSLVGNVGGLLTASVLLVFGERARARLVPSLVSYAVGTLLGAALLSLAPESLETLAPPRALATLLAGILVFFLLEKLAIWHHSHDEHEHHAHVHRSTVTLVVLGDTVHAAVDGVVIAAAALVSLPLGFTTALAVAAHEIPHRAGDFAILLGAGHSRGRAFGLSVASAAGGLAGAIAMLLYGEDAPRTLPYVLAFAAGNFLYIAMADLIPTLHHGHLDRSALRQIVLIGLGLGTIAVL